MKKIILLILFSSVLGTMVGNNFILDFSINSGGGVFSGTNFDLTFELTELGGSFQGTNFDLDLCTPGVGMCEETSSFACENEKCGFGRVNTCGLEGVFVSGTDIPAAAQVYRKKIQVPFTGVSGSKVKCVLRDSANNEFTIESAVSGGSATPTLNLGTSLTQTVQYTQHWTLINCSNYDASDNKLNTCDFNKPILVAPYNQLSDVVPGAIPCLTGNYFNYFDLPNEVIEGTGFTNGCTNEGDYFALLQYSLGSPDTEYECYDGLDNDRDGFQDFEDPDCNGRQNPSIMSFKLEEAS